MFKNMETLYQGLAEYYAFDKNKYTCEEFFGDLKTFKDSFLVGIAWSVNIITWELFTKIASINNVMFNKLGPGFKWGKGEGKSLL